jgi:STE24 endopeptidase
MHTTSDNARRYSIIKYSLATAETAYLFSILCLFQFSGASKTLANTFYGSGLPSWLVMPAYLLAIAILYAILNFPFYFYSSFVLEHSFALSRQTLKQWFNDQFKGALIAYGIGLVCLEAFYFAVRAFPDAWWVYVSVFWIFFSLIFAKLAPVAIVPLFFRYKRLDDEALKKRIISLAEKMKVKLLEVVEIDFSKKTVKANAAFLGFGSSRRVILADTLKDTFTADEIEVILAHEFAHFKLKHLLKIIALGALASAVSFYVIFKTSAYFLSILSLSSLQDIAALPLVLLYFSAMGLLLGPLENYCSRLFERHADLMALASTGLKEAFMSGMEKLASQNLADRSPHPVIKFFFFDHPPIDERIEMAEGFRPSPEK